MGTREEISMWTNIAEPRVRVSQKRTEESTAFKIDAVVSGFTKMSNLWVSFSDFV